MKDVWSGNPDTDRYWAKEDLVNEEDIQRRLGVDPRTIESEPIKVNREAP